MTDIKEILCNLYVPFGIVRHVKCSRCEFQNTKALWFLDRPVNLYQYSQLTSQKTSLHQQGCENPKNSRIAFWLLSKFIISRAPEGGLCFQSGNSVTRSVNSSNTTSRFGGKSF